MRFAYFVACFSTAMDFALRAGEVQPDYVLQPAANWLNWVGAVVWLMLGLRAFWWRPE